MRLRVFPIVVLLVLAAAAPREAAADMLDFFRWWDSLSGPGPWIGLGYQSSLQNIGVLRTEKEDNPRHSFFDPSGLRTNPRALYYKFGAELGVLWTDDSDLEYAPGVDPPKAYAFPILGTFDVGRNGLEGGVGVGFLRLSALDRGKWHFVFEPRFTVKPFVLANRNNENKEWHEMLAARFYLTRIGEINPADFGAIGPADAGSEWVPGITFSVNVLAIRAYIDKR